MSKPKKQEDITLSHSKNKKILGLSTLLMALPIVAACNPNTAAPRETTPEVGEAPTVPSDPAMTDPPMDPTAGLGTISEVAATAPSLSTFNSAVAAAELTGALNGPGPYTVFAPSNEAFDALPPETLQQLLAAENQDQLTGLLAYHVVPEQLLASQLQSGSVDTLAGIPLMVEVDPSAQSVMVNNAVVTQPNLETSNGIIHVVDQVMLPPTARR
jgi:uncharacterized surface protein with fasciclin (FAS1) repeats